MSYPTINAHRFLYNLDGTRVGYNTTSSYSNGITGYLTQTQLDKLQAENVSFSGSSNYCFWFFFPEQRDITHIVYAKSTSPSSCLSSIQGSNDTTNGIDGTWVDFTVPSGATRNWAIDANFWRTPSALEIPTGGNSFKVLRVYCYFNLAYLYALNIYGKKTTDTDDIIFLQSDGATKYTALQDFGDTPEGSVSNIDMYIKNTSTTFTANSIAVAVGGINASNITVSLDGTTYSSSVTVSSLAPGATQIIKVRNTVGAKPQTLVPRSAYLTATVTSWT